MTISLRKTRKTLFAMTTLIAVFLVPLFAFAFTTNHAFPKTNAWALNTGKANANELAKFDSVILNLNAHLTHPQLFRDLRRRNPNIVILAYVSAVEYPGGRLNEAEPGGTGPWHELGRGIQPEWYLKTTSGQQISFWPGHFSMNPSAKSSSGQTYANYVGNLYVDQVLRKGDYDGLLFDTTWETISWHDENIDIDNDRQKDSRNEIDTAWHDGQEEVFQTIRQRVGDRYLIITNGDGDFASVNNGRMFESFPEFWEGGWTGSIKRYFATDRGGNQPRFNIINVDTDNSGNFRNYKSMRFGLASTLLGNGYYNYDFGTQDRSFAPFYDEYNVDLGQPLKQAVNLLTGSGSVAEGIWRRDFSQGISLVNSTSQTRTIELNGDFEKIQGTQDRVVNNGSVVSHVTLPAQDGIVLLRPLQEVLDNPFENGAFARVFDANSHRSRASFFSYDSRFSGSQLVVKSDVDLDGRIETLAADASSITIYADNGAVKARIFPYGRAYGSGINFGIGDLNGDGTKEIVTGTGNGGGPHVRVFRSDGKLINPGFFAYATNFRGGVNIAVGDLNRDGVNEIIAGAGFGGGPHIRVFNKDGRLINPGFFAFNQAFRGGVNVAVGDINGDGQDEIIAGAGKTGGPHIKVFDRNGRMVTEFFAFSAKSNQGVRVGAYDFDGDRKDEIIGMTTDFTVFGR